MDQCDRDETASQARRVFLQRVVASSLGTIATGVLLYRIGEAAAPGSIEHYPGERRADQPVNNTVRWGMLVDAQRCTACGACVEACNKQHALLVTGAPQNDPQWIRIVHVKNRQTGHAFSLPMMCQHCAYPPCVDVCPTGASFKRADGIVLVDKHICIGCRYCMMACPYKARSFISCNVETHVPSNPSGKGTVEGCTMCVYKIDREHIDGINGTTACAEACRREGNGAILFGDLKDPDSEIARQLAQYGATQIRANLNLDTGVRYRVVEG
jgi:tetrathionate reductase subunit B